MSKHQAEASQHASKGHVRTITENQLPLSCPPEGETLWDMHPKVYLPIDRTGKATCPYCSAQYVLKTN